MKVALKRLLVVSLTVKLDKIKDSTGGHATDDNTSILREKNFNLGVFRDKVKQSYKI